MYLCVFPCIDDFMNAVNFSALYCWDVGIVKMCLYHSFFPAQRTLASFSIPESSKQKFSINANVTLQHTARAQNA